MSIMVQLLPADVGLGSEVLECGLMHGLGALPDMGVDVAVQLHAEQLQLSLQRPREGREGGPQGRGGEHGVRERGGWS